MQHEINAIRAELADVQESFQISKNKLMAVMLKASNWDDCVEIHRVCEAIMRDCDQFGRLIMQKAEKL